MTTARNKGHLAYWIAGGLYLSFFLSLVGSFFHYQGTGQTILFKMDGLCAVAALACLGAKATTEGYDVAGAGFNVLAISQGLFLTQIDQPGHWNYEAAITAVIFMIPSMFMIAYYSRFPRWIRLAGVASTIPFMTLASIYFLKQQRPSHIFENVVYLLFQVITLCWAWYTWRQRKEDVNVAS